MRIVHALLLLSLGAGPALATGSGPLDNKCTRPDAYQAQRGQPANPRRLDQLPPGNLELAVWRHLAGCQQPAIVRRDVAIQRR